MPLTHFDAEGKARMVDVTEKKAMCFLWRPQPGSWV